MPHLVLRGLCDLDTSEGSGNAAIGSLPVKQKKLSAETFTALQPSTAKIYLVPHRFKPFLYISS
jgi:hypothetical protein